MPLFTMPKKSEIKQDIIKDDKIIKEETKPQIKPNFEDLKEEYAILGATDKKFYYILYLKKCAPMKNVQYTYTSPEEKDTQILLELFALKRLLENQFLTLDSIIVYCNLDLPMIENYSNLTDCGSMFRYKAREIRNLLNEGQIKIDFRKPTDAMKELINNENQLQ